MVGKIPAVTETGVKKTAGHVHAPRPGKFGETVCVERVADHSPEAVKIQPVLLSSHVEFLCQQTAGLLLSITKVLHPALQKRSGRPGLGGCLVTFHLYFKELFHAELGHGSPESLHAKAAEGIAEVCPDFQFHNLTLKKGRHEENTFPGRPRSLRR